MIDDERVRELRQNIIDDFHAAESARELLSLAFFFIQTGEPASQALRDVIADALEHLSDGDPLLAFGHLTKRPKRRGRPAKESEEELTQVLGDIMRLHQRGVPLIGQGERWPFKSTDGTAFAAYVAQRNVGNQFAAKKEARRLQAAFWKRVRRMTFAQQEALGLSQYFPRKK